MPDQPEEPKPQQVVADLAPEIAEDYYIVLIPRFGDPQIRCYPTMKLFCRELCEWFDAMDSRRYDGLIVPFFGKIIPFTSVLRSWRVMLQGREFEMSLSSQQMEYKELDIVHVEEPEVIPNTGDKI